MTPIRGAARLVVLADVLAVEKDSPLGRLVEARQQLDEVVLPAPF
jgi:hypothetical protein